MDHVNYILKLKQIARAFDISLVEDLSVNAKGVYINKNAKRHGHVRPDTLLSVGAIFGVPLLFNIPNFILTVFNPCIKYAEALYLNTFILFIVAFSISWVHLFLYSYYVWYCNWDILKIHNLQIVVFYSMMGSTLGFFNLYANTLTFWNFIAVCICGFGTLIMYFIVVFQRRHFYFCPEDGCREIPAGSFICNISLEDVYTGLGAVFILTWSGFLIVPVVLSDDLYLITSSARQALGCSGY